MSRHQFGTLKRREPDDLVQELLNVSLSPPKRLRSLDAEVTDSSGLSSNLAPNDPSSSEMPWAFQGIPIPERPEPSIVSTSGPNEEKALVLYRPVTPPMFPGGPPEGSVDFPYKVNASLLPIPQGTDRELTSHQLDFQSACSSDTDASSGHGLFQALDLSGSRGPLLPGQRRMNRVSSCSSLPRFGADSEDQAMGEDADKSTQMAVIPWVPVTPLMVHPNARPAVEDTDDESADNPLVDPMEEEDAMDIVDGGNETMAETSVTPMPGQFGSPASSFSAAPWQAEMQQPPFHHSNVVTLAQKHCYSSVDEI